MKKGKVNAALNQLINNMKDRILPINDETLNSLKEKYLDSKNVNTDVLLTRIRKTVHPIMLAGIDQEMIRKAAIKTDGRFGPSAMDADGWRRILCSNNFNDTNVDLR